MPDETDQAHDADESGLEDFERVFVVGGPSFDDLTPDELAERRRSKRVALVALGVAAAIVAVAITLVALLVDPSPSTPAHHRTGGCPSPTSTRPESPTCATTSR